MSLITILLFFIYTYGLGFSITFFAKNSENFFERNLMRLGIGLGTIPLMGVVLNLFHIPIDWKIFFLLSLVIPCYSIVKNRRISAPSLKLTKSNINILVVILFFFLTLFMYEKGAFTYDYLEDDDSWHHAQSTKYISVEKTAYEKQGKGFLSFTDPYPPGYGIMMAVLHQTSDSISWTIKFFNALIASLGIIFFYFFVKQFSGNKNKALFAVFILAAIPCYLSHFIWAHVLIVTLFFPAFYCLERIKDDKKWVFASALVIGSILVTQITQSMKFSMLFAIYFIIKSVLKRKFLIYTFLSALSGFVLSFIWWGIMLMKYNGLMNLVFKVFALKSSAKIVMGKKIYGPMGTVKRLYTFDDFFIAKTQNMINNPIGVGIILCIVLFISLIIIILRYKSLLKEKNSWLLITLLWLVFTFLGIHGGTRLPVAFFPFRFWMLFAIPVSIIAAEGTFFMANFLKKYNISKVITVGVIIIGVLLTSGYQKYKVNTSMWPPGATWTSYEEVNGYLWLKTLPVDTKVFAFTRDRSHYIIGFDKFMCVWCKEDMDFQKNAINETAEELHSWLKSKRYEYVTIGGKEAMNFGINKTNEKVNELVSSKLFQPVHQTQGVVIFKVV